MTNSSAEAKFCILTDQQYNSWFSTYASTTNYGPTFPWSQCKTQAGPTTQTTLTFTPDSPGTWDVVVINNNPTPINIQFSPA